MVLSKLRQSHRISVWQTGCAGSVLNILQMDRFNHQVELTKGVLQEECSTMLSEFFKELREKKKVKFT